MLTIGCPPLPSPLYNFILASPSAILSACNPDHIEPVPVFLFGSKKDYTFSSTHSQHTKSSFSSLFFSPNNSNPKQTQESHVVLPRNSLFISCAQRRPKSHKTFRRILCPRNRSMRRGDEGRRHAGFNGALYLNLPQADDDGGRGMKTYGEETPAEGDRDRL